MSQKDNVYISDKDGLVRFDLLKLDNDAKKLCTCKYPHFNLDMKNRIVRCLDCGAIVDPYEALESFANQIERFSEYQQKVKKEIESQAEEANRQRRRRFKNQAFKDMESAYMQNLLPCCPHCDKPFDPIDIRHSTNRNYCDWEVEKQ